MRSQVFGKMMSSVAFALAMTNDNNSTAQRHGVGDPRVIRGLFWRSLAPFTGLILVHEMVQEVMRVVGFDHVFRSLVGRNIDMENLCPMMIDDDQQVWRERIGMRASLGRMLG